jgi:hypothetical protein
MDTSQESSRIIIGDSELLRNIPTSNKFRALSIHSAPDAPKNATDTHLHLYQPIGPFELLNALCILMRGIDTDPAVKSEGSLIVKKSISKSTSSGMSTVEPALYDMVVLIVEGNII